MWIFTCFSIKQNLFVFARLVCFLYIFVLIVVDLVVSTSTINCPEDSCVAWDVKLHSLTFLWLSLFWFARRTGYTNKDMEKYKKSQVNRKQQICSLPLDSQHLFVFCNKGSMLKVSCSTASAVNLYTWRSCQLILHFDRLNGNDFQATMTTL